MQILRSQVYHLINARNYEVASKFLQHCPILVTRHPTVELEVTHLNKFFHEQLKGTSSEVDNMCHTTYHETWEWLEDFKELILPIVTQEGFTWK